MLSNGIKIMKIVYYAYTRYRCKISSGIIEKFWIYEYHSLPEQDVVSGDFPTVVSPNPEEPAALDMAIRKGIEVDADIVMASDPDPIVLV